MISVLAERLADDIHEYDPTAVDLDAFLDESQDDKRNPLSSLGEEISLILNQDGASDILRAVETLPEFQDMVAEHDDDEPDYGMIGGDAPVRLAMGEVGEIWAARRQNSAPSTLRP
jgi:hypothetical protein